MAKCCLRKVSQAVSFRRPYGESDRAAIELDRGVSVLRPRVRVRRRGAGLPGRRLVARPLARHAPGVHDGGRPGGSGTGNAVHLAASPRAPGPVRQVMLGLALTAAVGAASWWLGGAAPAGGGPPGGG